MSTGSFDSSIEGRKEKSRTPCSSRGFCLFVLSVMVLFCYFISISGCSYRRRKNIFCWTKLLLKRELKRDCFKVVFFFPVDVLIYWYADLETTSMLGSCLILIVYYSSTFFEAQKKKKRRSCFFKLQHYRNIYVNIIMLKTTKSICMFVYIYVYTNACRYTYVYVHACVYALYIYILYI